MAIVSWAARTGSETPHSAVESVEIFLPVPRGLLVLKGFDAPKEGRKKKKTDPDIIQTELCPR